MTEFELRPFRWDNPLAFLALLGLMRALDAARPEWRARAFWRRRGGRGPWVPVVAIEENVPDEEAFAAEAERGVLELAAVHEFDGRKDADFAVDEFRVMAAEAGGWRAELLAALASDGVLRDQKKRSVQPTPLCTMFGQGHQHFLERIGIRDAATGGVHLPLERRQDGAELLRKALFEEWEAQRDPDFGGLRLDPKEDRRYAYQAADPTSTAGKIGTVPGANRLAAVAIPLFPVFPTARGLAATGFARHEEGHTVTWPLWTAAARLTAIRHLLAHPELVAARPRTDGLRPHGVVELMRARRVAVGKFVSFTRGEPLWGTPPS